MLTVLDGGGQWGARGPAPPPLLPEPRSLWASPRQGHRDVVAPETWPPSALLFPTKCLPRMSWCRTTARSPLERKTQRAEPGGRHAPGGSRPGRLPALCVAALRPPWSEGSSPAPWLCAGGTVPGRRAPPPPAAGRGGAGPVSSERGALTAIQNVAQPRASLIWEMRGLLAACCSRLSFLNVFSSPCQSCRDARSPWKPLVKISCSVLIIEFQPSRARSLWAAERRPGGKAAPTPVAAAGPPSAPCGESGLGQWLRALE